MLFDWVFLLRFRMFCPISWVLLVIHSSAPHRFHSKQFSVRWDPWDECFVRIRFGGGRGEKKTVSPILISYCYNNITESRWNNFHRSHKHMYTETAFSAYICYNSNRARTHTKHIKCNIFLLLLLVFSVRFVKLWRCCVSSLSLLVVSIVAFSISQTVRWLLPSTYTCR